MRPLKRVKDLLSQWDVTDPYQYECTVCERTFQSKRAICPDCGGDVDRVDATAELSANAHP